MSTRVFDIIHVFVSNYKGRELMTVSIWRNWTLGCAGGLVPVKWEGAQEWCCQSLDDQVCVFSRYKMLGDSGRVWGSLRGRKDFPNREYCSLSKITS